MCRTGRESCGQSGGSSTVTVRGAGEAVQVARGALWMSRLRWRGETGGRGRVPGVRSGTGSDGRRDGGVGRDREGSRRVTRRQEKWKGHANGGVSSWPGMSCSAVQSVACGALESLGRILVSMGCCRQVQVQVPFHEACLGHAGSRAHAAEICNRRHVPGPGRLTNSPRRPGALEPWSVLTDCTLE